MWFYGIFVAFPSNKHVDDDDHDDALRLLDPPEQGSSAVTKLQGMGM